MNIKYEIDESLRDDELIIRCKLISSKLLEIEKIINSDTVESVFGVQESKIFPIKAYTIERIYSENRKTIIFSKGETYESKKNLSNFESILPKSFVRISKSVIANTKLIQSIESEFSGNYTLIFMSGNKEILSRNYVKDLKTAIGLEG